MTAVPVNGLVTDANLKTLSGLTGTDSLDVRLPIITRQDDSAITDNGNRNTGDVPLCHFGCKVIIHFVSVCRRCTPEQKKKGKRSYRSKFHQIHLQKHVSPSEKPTVGQVLQDTQRRQVLGLALNRPAFTNSSPEFRIQQRLLLR